VVENLPFLCCYKTSSGNLPPKGYKFARFTYKPQPHYIQKSETANTQRQRAADAHCKVAQQSVIHLQLDAQSYTYVC